ncbi:MAG: type II toxin-antitoxin system VapC family toxin [Spirochaetaceae bacterium]|jgi:predicted nucleic acid-binding protein|nr:type II toxin-antitoxin system VapC family toxin [Spirochaetaceae bacterium]
MNGPTNEKYVFDTNTVIGFIDKKFLSLPLGERFISVITEMELLAFPSITPEIEGEILNFLNAATIIPLTDEVKHEAIHLRREGIPRPKLPDAIVAASAVVLDAMLVSADEKLNKLNWPGLKTTSIK